MSIVQKFGAKLGTTTNDNAQAGQIGEYLETEVLVASVVSLTTATPADIATLALTAGDWDVWGTVCFEPAATTAITLMLGWINTTTATAPTKPGKGAILQLGAVIGAGLRESIPVGMRRYSLASPTTIYLGAQANFTVDTLGAYGIICARRVR